MKIDTAELRTGSCILNVLHSMMTETCQKNEHSAQLCREGSRLCCSPCAIFARTYLSEPHIHPLFLIILVVDMFSLLHKHTIHLSICT